MYNKKLPSLFCSDGYLASIQLLNLLWPLYPLLTLCHMIISSACISCPTILCRGRLCICRKIYCDINSFLYCKFLAITWQYESNKLWIFQLIWFFLSNRFSVTRVEVGTPTNPEVRPPRNTGICWRDKTFPFLFRLWCLGEADWFLRTRNLKAFIESF